MAIKIELDDAAEQLYRARFAMEVDFWGKAGCKQKLEAKAWQVQMKSISIENEGSFFKPIFKITIVGSETACQAFANWLNRIGQYSDGMKVL